jgi:hypothetical protein
VNEKEYDLIKLYTGFDDRYNEDSKFNLNFLVFSTLLIDGENFLVNRPCRYKELLDLYEQFPKDLFNNLLKGLTEIREVALSCKKYLEGFCYTNFSRKIWVTLNECLPNSVSVTGINGTNELGTNVYQDYWIYVNKKLDSEVAYSEQFYLAVMTTSASNPKGAKQVRAKYDATLKEQEEKRKKIAELGYIDVKEQWSLDGWSASVDTPEELLAELERQMSGVKDKHDLFIEEYIRNLKKEADDALIEARQRSEELMKESGELEFSGGSRPATPEDLARLQHSNGHQVPDEEQASLEDKDIFLSRVGGKVLTGKKG